MAARKENTISVDQLQVGVYVYLDVGWMNHPFGFNNFKIRSEEQIRTIRQMGLSAVRWDPDRSDQKPLAPPAPRTAGATTAGLSGQETTADGAPTAGQDDPIMAAKRERMCRLAALREQHARVEQAFLGTATVVRTINKTIFSQPAKTIADTTALVGQMVDQLLAAPDLAIQVMNENPRGENVYFHALNVAVLAMVLGRELGLPAEDVRTLGLGALFHDIGLAEVPSRILYNTGTLTKAEREFRELHCEYGLNIGKKAGLPAGVLQIIYQHHENFDGSGYLRRLKGEAIDVLARIVAIVNTYDNLCNPVNVAQALTPHEALSQMFAVRRNHFDPKLLQLFIHFMGVYPPGTVVSFSNNAIGLVISVNQTHPLRPTVVVYDPEVPKQEAIVLDLLEEPDINITKAIRPAQLLPAVFDYLSPRRRVSYYFDAGKKPQGAPPT
ncbi:MAG: HD-GYP domain-containing protein [Burkholderiales bacterium]